MVWKRAAGLIVAGTFMVGCASHHETPHASAAVQPMDPGAVAGLEQSWRESHPGSMIGHVNAVLPDRHVLSVTGLPLDQIHAGDVVSILLNGTGSSVVSARVYDKSSGYAQLEYSPLEAGQPAPREGDLAIWYAAGTPGSDQSISAAASSGAMPTTQPGATTPEMPPTPAPTTPTAPPPETTAPPATPAPTPPPPGNNATTPPATAPTPPATPPADATPPPPANNGAATGATPAPPPPGQTPPPPAPDNKLPADLNK